MIKKLLLALTLLSFNLYAGAYSDALKADVLKAYYSGDKQKAVQLYTKACDGGSVYGCKNYRILNEQGY